MQLTVKTLKEVRIAGDGFRVLGPGTLNVESGLFAIVGENQDCPEASSNMSGKSTFLTAICWCLYGVDSNGSVLKAAEDVIPFGKQTSAVTLVFEDAMGGSLSVMRDRWFENRSSTKTSLGIQWSNPGELPTCDSGAVVDIQLKVDEEFGPRDLFLAAHVFGCGEGEKPFALSSDREQKRLFDLLLDVGDLDEAYDRALVEHNTTMKTLTKIDASLGKVASSTVTTQELLQDLNINSVLTPTPEHQVNTTQVLRDVTQRRIQHFDRRVKRLWGMRDQLATQTLQLTTMTAANAQRCDSLTITLAALRKPYEETIEDLHTITEAKCPLCKSSISPETVNLLIYSQELEIQKLQDSTSAAVASLLEENLDYDSVCADVMRLAARVTFLLDRIENSLIVLNAQLATHDATLVAAKQHLADKQANVAEQRGVLQGKITVLEKKTASLEIAHAAVKDKLQIIAFWLEAYGPRGIRAYRLDQVTPDLNAIAERYSHEVFGDGTCLRYSTQTRLKSGDIREKFSAVLHAIDPITHKWVPVKGRLSSGQAMRRDVVHVLSMAELADKLSKRSVDLLAFDEVFRTLDSRGIEAVQRILRARTKHVATIWVAEHNEELAAGFDRSLTVVRDAGVATIHSDGG